MILNTCIYHFKSSKKREKWPKKAKCMGFMLFDGIKRGTSSFIHTFLMDFHETKCADVFYGLEYMYPPFESTICEVWGRGNSSISAFWFDGPSVPSQNCCSSCPSTTGPISLLFVWTWSQYTPLRCLTQVSSKISGVSQNGRRRPQKGNRHPFGCHFGHIHPWWRGDKLGNPLKVNISWFMTLFSEFFITSSPVMNISWFMALFSEFWHPAGPGPGFLHCLLNLNFLSGKHVTALI